MGMLMMIMRMLSEDEDDYYLELSHPAHVCPKVVADDDDNEDEDDEVYKEQFLIQLKYALSFLILSKHGLKIPDTFMCTMVMII